MSETTSLGCSPKTNSKVIVKHITVMTQCFFLVLHSHGDDNLGTNKLQESADDKKTWKQKTDEVLHVRRALDSAFSV